MLSNTALSNPNMQRGIKKNKQSTQNTPNTTRYLPATFNDHTWQHQSASKIMPASIVSEPNQYLAVNQNNLAKTDNNFKNNLSTTKINKTSSINKNSQYKASDSSDISNAPIGLDNYYNSRFYPISYQPPLEKNIVREVALFKALLKPFKNLPPLSRT